ncbi:MAG: nitroreductase family protein [Candidatus Cloacimonadaceae bacterium]|jgi:nitroreductase
MKQRPIYDYPIDEIIQKRWSPRAYAPTPLSDEQVLTLLEAARWAASCMNTQPWRFIWAHNDGSEKYQKLFSCLMEGNQAWAKQAPVLIMALANLPEGGGFCNQWAAYDLGLAIGNLTTQASLMDLYVHNMAGFSEEKVRELFEIDAQLKPVIMLTVGHPGDASLLSEFNQQRELKVQERKPLEELILF